MNIENKFYGATASVYLKYDGDIYGVAKKLSEGLKAPKFNIEPSEYSPYELIGSCESFGFESWLEKIDVVNGYNYLYKIETEHCFDEILNGDMYDLSAWLARFISEICEVDASVMNSD